MIFLPKGAANTEVLDPELIGRDAVEAFRIAQLTTQYQWASSAFTDINKFVKGQPFTARALVHNEATLRTVPGTWPIVKYDIGYDTNQWLIPYNRGLVTIKHALPDEASGTWTSTYPEMVWSIFSGWYFRRSTTRTPFSTYFGVAGRGVRAQFRLRVDGQDKPGTGPMAWPLDGKSRGVGYGAQALACCFLDISFLPAGTHTVQAMAGQASSVGTNESTDDKDSYGDGAPAEGVVVGSYNFFVLTMPFARVLTP